VIAEDPEQMSGDVCDVTCGQCYHSWYFAEACKVQGITSEAQRLAGANGYDETDRHRGGAMSRYRVTGFDPTLR
jgi:hypothetical protein